MNKFVGGFITGSVLTLLGIGIAAVINDGTLSNPFDACDVLSGDVDSDDNIEKEDEKDSDPSENGSIIDEVAKNVGIVGRGLETILNAAADGAERFEKSLSEVVGESDESSTKEDS